jgi:hypothetical protein
VEVARSSPHVAIDDVGARVDRLGAGKLLAADGVHLSAAGREAVADQVASAVKGALEGPPATLDAVCRRTRRAPRIDGRPTDEAWANASTIDRFPAFWNGEPGTNATRARLLWDDDALYFAAEMDDAELRSFGTKRNDRLWEGDVFELFFKPRRDQPAYYEFQVNPHSVILELAFPRRGFDFATLAARPPLGLTAAAVAEGTVDHPGDRDHGWTVEGRIPWSTFAPTGGRPEPGAVWSFALCRYDYGPPGTSPVLTSSAPLTRRSFHRYEDYGRLHFEGPQP